MPVDPAYEPVAVPSECSAVQREESPTGAGESDETFWAMLAAADPAADAGLDPARADAMLASVSDAKPRRWRKRAVAVVAAAVTIGVGIPVGAYAGSYLTRTGEYGPDFNVGQPNQKAANTSTESDSSEWLDPLASDFVDYAVTLWPKEAVLPAGVDQETFARGVATKIQQSVIDGQAPDSPGARMQATNVKATMEGAAQCEWLGVWVKAYDAKDVKTRDHAAQVYQQSMSWTELQFSFRYILPELKKVAQAAIDGDIGPVWDEYDVNCLGNNTPGSHHAR